MFLVELGIGFVDLFCCCMNLLSKSMVFLDEALDFIRSWFLPIFNAFNKLPKDRMGHLDNRIGIWFVCFSNALTNDFFSSKIAFCPFAFGNFDKTVLSRSFLFDQPC